MKKYTIHGFRKKFFRGFNEPKRNDERYIDCLIWGVDNHSKEYSEASFNDFPRIFVPEHEFEELVDELPRFEGLPITYLGWNDRNKPTKFIIECFDIDEKVMIDTAGYDYPRYKAAIT